MDGKERGDREEATVQRGAPEAVLITGGAGSLGTELVRVLMERTDAAIRILDINEHAVHLLVQKWGLERLRPFPDSVADLYRVKRAMENVDWVFHLAALKHVYLGESNPMSVLKTNVMGTQNVINAVLDEKDVEVMVFTSSDKAVNPSNIYGRSKIFGESLVLNAEKVKGDRPTAFTVFRPGNFFISRGNVIEKWQKQRANGEALTLTKGDMRRYFIGIGKAAELLYDIALYAEGGDIFIPKMKEYPMKEIAELLAGKIEWVDPRPGEKEREELYTEMETPYLRDLNEELMVIKP